MKIGPEKALSPPEREAMREEMGLGEGEEEAQEI